MTDYSGDLRPDLIVRRKTVRTHWSRHYQLFIVRHQELMAPATGRHFHLKCPEGKRPVSRGWSGIEREMVIGHAYPGRDGQTWHFVGIYNVGLVTINLAVICVDAPGKEAR